MEFPCQKCACCCKTVGKMVDDAKVQVEDKKARRLPFDFALLIEISQFPFKYSESGRCEMLDDEGKCMVYSQRPLMCNTRAMFKKFYHAFYTFKQFVALNNRICNLMREKANG